MNNYWYTDTSTMTEEDWISYTTMAPIFPIKKGLVGRYWQFELTAKEQNHKKRFNGNEWEDLGTCNVSQDADGDCI